MNYSDSIDKGTQTNKIIYIVGFELHPLQGGLNAQHLVLTELLKYRYCPFPILFILPCASIPSLSPSPLADMWQTGHPRPGTTQPRGTSMAWHG